MLNKVFYSLPVNRTSILLYNELSINQKMKVQMLLESEFIYMVNCLIAETNENGFTFAYDLLKTCDKERRK